MVDILQKKLGFGCMRLPLTEAEVQGKVDMAQFERMVDTFLERGFTYFDTAYMYHDFQSEIAVREAVVKRHPRNTFTLASKLPSMMLEKEGDQERIFSEQLEKCGIEYFDYYMLHNICEAFYPALKRFHSFEFLSKLKSEGKIKNMGFSFHDSPELLEQVLIEHPEVDFVQLQINYYDWDDHITRSRELYDIATKHGKKIIVMEPVRGGMLANVPEKTEKLLRSAEPDSSPASWAIRFTADLDNVMIVLSGMSNYEQLLDNTSYMADFKGFTDEQRCTISKAYRSIKDSVVIPCTMCRYCTKGCPKDIPIPEYFALYNTEMQNRQIKGFSIQAMTYDAYTKKHEKASECIECGQCETNCPQHISIIDLLKDVARTLEVN